MYKKISGSAKTMMYPEEVISPMRAELVDFGFTELRTVEDVIDCFGDNETNKQSTLLVVNSVCGCSAGGCRPSVRIAITGEKKPERLVTVFAGQDTEATAKAREYIVGYAPSSPMIALFVDGKPVFALERHQIEGRTVEQISGDLTSAFARLL